MILAPRAGTRHGRWHSGGVQRWSGLDAVPAGFGPSVVTIGNFDGVHRGHRACWRRWSRPPGSARLPAVAVTFEPHPLAVLFPERAPGVLTAPDHRLELLAETGLDAVLVLEFTREFAQWSPERFVREVFVDALRAALVVVGPRHPVRPPQQRRRGHAAAISARSCGFAVETVPEFGLGSGRAARRRGARRWSSTLGARAARRGRRRPAPRRCSGARTGSTGVVVHGDHRGRELGYPTANLSRTPSARCPPTGSTPAGWCARSCRRTPRTPSCRPPSPSAPTRPSTALERRVEAYVLDRDRPRPVRRAASAVEFVERLRPTLRFDGVDAWSRRWRCDVARCRELLGVPAAPDASLRFGLRRRRW